MAKYRVKNISDINVGRGGVVFPAGKVLDVLMEEGSIKYREIKACCRLKILGLADIPKKAVISHAVAAAPVDVTTKVSENSEVTTIESSKKAPIKAANENPLNESKDKKEATKEVKNGDIDCPYCDFNGTRAGMFAHVRLKHPNHYEAFKTRMQSV